MLESSRIHGFPKLFLGARGTAVHCCIVGHRVDAQHMAHQICQQAQRQRPREGGHGGAHRNDVLGQGGTK